jgi:hypothetical protein
MRVPALSPFPNMETVRPIERQPLYNLSEVGCGKEEKE